MKAELRPAGTGGPRRCGDGGAGVSMKVSLSEGAGGWASRCFFGYEGGLGESASAAVIG